MLSVLYVDWHISKSYLFYVCLKAATLERISS